MSSLSTHLKTVTALIIDPSPYFSQILKDILQQFGVQGTVVCDDTESARSILMRIPVHVVFCDIHVNPGGGIRLLNKLRKPIQGHSETVPIIIMAEKARIQDVYKARDGGANEFLTKPVSMKKVERVLQSCFEKPRPFIEADDYKGPDRRRKQIQIGPNRRDPAL